MFRSCVLIAALIALVGSNNPTQKAGKDWYKNSLIYQIYPRSFKDSDGDGIGDLKGITSKLEHIADIGADALWMSPIFKSPQYDFGYDISNFTDINEEYGTLKDFDELVAKAKSLGLKVILDFVPNHSSNESDWFFKSVDRIKPYDEYYIWHDGKILNGTRVPPNNWMSVFGGSAWQWNATRKQYYFHQFAVGQPDLNYRSPAVQEEMKKVLTFWMNRGVEGFRIDAINHMYEDARLLDEPPSNIPGLPEDDYDILNHIYTKNLNETYEVLKTWRQLMDNHNKNSDTKMILTEAYTDFDLTMLYYKSGSTVPFNFMFMGDLKNVSSAADFKRYIDRWMDNIPNGPQYVANWVVGNHDNHRAASRFGEKRADQLSMLAIVLPGVSVVYNGDEIGMVDRNFTYEETKDPAGCNAGRERYPLKSRDPERTPFQWDDSTSAGFSTNKTTWLPVNSNYKVLNLAAQKAEFVSHYRMFKRMAQLKKKPVIEQGSLETALYCADCTGTENVLGVVRRYKINDDKESIVVVLVNFVDIKVATVDVGTWLNIPQQLRVYAPSVHSKLLPGSRINMASVTLPGAASIVLATEDLFE
ncbi:alpha-glucosidase-like [Temnothorax curvispinosus]|uniref:alpha-glucosidase n=1 Tax=Temnothorax curvispinosus TaxID=300111 RepID=A0A6J1Q143_9HYME|nr:alpha-glucosidase-like [Temnothorax curvispinosus]